MAESHKHFVLFSDYMTKIGEVSDSDPYFERKIFEIICDHAMDLDGLAHGDEVDRIANYRFTNALGRTIEVTVEVGNVANDILEEMEPSE